jgi:hypothetical protein
MIEEIDKIRVQGARGRDEIVEHVPAMSLAPIFALYYASFMAQKVKFSSEFIEYEFHPISMKLVPREKFHEDYVKEIISEFAPN